MVNILSIFAALAVAVAPVKAQGGCYASGLVFPNKNDAYYHANRACYGYNDGNGPMRGAFQNTYFQPYNQSPRPATVCVNINDWHIVMQWTNQFNSGKELDPSTCWNRLKEIIDVCGLGGEFQTSDGTPGYRWKYRLDPNSGGCP